MHRVCLIEESGSLKQGNREYAPGIECWKMVFFFLKIVFLPGNHKRSAGEIRCDPPTVGRKGILGVGTRETQM